MVSFQLETYLFAVIVDIFDIDDSRGQLLKADIVASMDRMLKSSNEAIHSPCIRLLSKLAKYGRHLPLGWWYG